MGQDEGFDKAKLKTHRQVTLVHPDALFWGKPSRDGLIGADCVVLPYLGKTVWLRKKRHDPYDFHSEIKDSGGIIILPKWIAWFDSADLVPPAEYANRHRDCDAGDDTWVEPHEERFLTIDELLIVTG